MQKKSGGGGLEAKKTKNTLVYDSLFIYVLFFWGCVLNILRDICMFFLS